MFYAVIAAYVVSAIFAFCGIVNLVSYIGAAEQTVGYAHFIAGLPYAIWPLAIAAALVMLVQIAALIEKWMLFWKMKPQVSIAQPAIPQASVQQPPLPPQMAETPAAPTIPMRSAPAAPPYTAVQTPSPAMPYHFTSQISAVTPPVLGEEPAAASPIPTVSLEAPAESAQTRPTSAPGQWAPAPQEEELSFFKLD